MVLQRQIIHLTHTDPRVDSRILKELTVLAREHAGDLVVIGFANASAMPQSRELPEGVSFRVLPGEDPGQPEARIRERSHFVHFVRSRFRRHFSSFRGSALAVKSSRRLAIKVREAFRKFVTVLKLFSRMIAVPQIVLPKYYRSRLERSGELAPLREGAIIHVHDFYLLESGVSLKRRLGGKLIYDAHELESQTNGLSWASGVWIKARERRHWCEVDGLISVSPSILDFYQNKVGQVDSALVLNSPSALVPSSHGPASRGIREAIGLHEDDLLFVYLGYLIPGRGIEGVLEAFKLLPDEFHVAFVGEGRLSSEIETASQVSRKIHLVPPVPHEKVVSFVSTADYGLCVLEPVSLSDKLALPNKLFEYLFAGLPVVGSQLPEIRRLLRSLDAGVLVNPNANSIAEGCRAISSRQNWGPWDLEPLSWQKQGEEVIALYSRILNDFDK